MPKTTAFITGIILLAAGCVARQDVDPDSIAGRPLAEVIETYQLDKHEARPWINLPEGPQATTYFLEKGNLELWYMGEPAMVTKALYLPSD